MANQNNIGDVYVVVTERDNHEKFKNSGSIVGETYIEKASLSEAIERAKKLNGSYGDVLICKLEVVGNIEDCELIDGPF